MAYGRDNRSNSGGRDFGRRSFDSGRSGDRDRGGDRQMTKVMCSNCNKECEVPFKPTGSRPVYCSDCFRSMGGGFETRRSDDRGSRSSNYDSRDRTPAQPQNREQFEALNAKLDKIIKLLSPEKVTADPKVVKDSGKKKAKTKKVPSAEAPVETITPEETPTE